MKQSKVGEFEIVAILAEGHAGVAVAQSLRRHRIGRATYSNWRSK